MIREITLDKQCMLSCMVSKITQISTYVLAYYPKTLNAMNHVLIKRILKEIGNNSIQNVLYMAYNILKIRGAIHQSSYSTCIELNMKTNNVVSVVKPTAVSWKSWVNRITQEPLNYSDAPLTLHLYQVWVLSLINVWFKFLLKWFELASYTIPSQNPPSPPSAALWLLSAYISLSEKTFWLCAGIWLFLICLGMDKYLKFLFTQTYHAGYQFFG